MIVFWSYPFTVLCVIISMNFVMIDSFRVNKGPSTSFPGEFENFIQGLGSMVYRYKKPRLSDNRRYKHEYSYTTTKASQILRRNEFPFGSQREAVRDALMMKLVSYYENKYKIPHYDQPLTTEANIVNYFNDVTDIIPTNAPTTEIETTTQSGDWLKGGRRKINDSNVPEVVVL